MNGMPNVAVSQIVEKHQKQDISDSSISNDGLAINKDFEISL